MPIRRLYNPHFVGIIIDTGNSPEEKNPFCPRCQKLGIYSRLKQRIYLDDNGKLLPPPPDHDNWLQCWKCSLIIPITSAKWEGQIKGIQGITPIENPNDFNKKSILGTEDLKDRYHKLKKSTDKHPDKEIQAYLDQGWDLTSYSNSVPT